MSKAIATVRVALDETAFRALVKGEVARLRASADDRVVEVQLILSDIGWERMAGALRDAMAPALEAAMDKNRRGGGSGAGK